MDERFLWEVSETAGIRRGAAVDLSAFDAVVFGGHG